MHVGQIIQKHPERVKFERKASVLTVTKTYGPRLPRVKRRLWVTIFVTVAQPHPSEYTDHHEVEGEDYGVE